MRDLSPDDEVVLKAAITSLRRLTGNRPVLCIIGFESGGGMHVASASNLCQHDQIEMMKILTEGFEPLPRNATLN